MNTKYIIIILITSVLLGAVFYGTENRETNPASPSVMNSSTEQNQNSSTDKIARDTEVKYEPLEFPDNNLDTSGWKTYQNEEFGFEVKYPSDWVMEFNSIKNNTVNGTVGDGFSGDGYGGTLRFFPEGVVNINGLELIRVRDLSFDDQIFNLENNEISLSTGVKKYIRINNVVGVETKDFEGPGFYVYERYILEGKNNMTYEFSGLNEPGADKHKSEIEQIILSFKIVN